MLEVGESYQAMFDELCPKAGALPTAITEPMAWIAFDQVFSSTDWRLRILALDPISFAVEYDDDFARCLSGGSSWQSRHQALSWIAKRVLELASSFDKTYVRRLSLQVPNSHESSVAEALLSSLERRIRDTILDELVRHFDTSISEWERKLQVAVAQVNDAHQRWLLRRYTGLDQLVPVDAARKAIRFVFDRTHWHLTTADRSTVLHPDHRFEVLRSQRCALHEETRARSLVARCVEALLEAHVEQQRLGVPVAPMTRKRLRAEVDRLFHEKGVWGLVELALPQDRARHYLMLPEATSQPLSDLLEQQEGRLH